jgi:hypothetical protein
MPSEWALDLLRSPQSFCLQLTPTQLDTFAAVEAAHFFFETAEPDAAPDAAPGEALPEAMVVRGNRRESVGASMFALPPLIVPREFGAKYVPSGSPEKPKSMR